MPTTTAEAFEEARALDGPLGTKLAYYKSALRALGSPFADAYDDLVARIVTGEVAAMAPAVGETMPPFLLPTEDGQLVHSGTIFAEGATVVSFNRGHWCPFCRLEVHAQAAAAEEIAARGGRIVSIAPEPAAFLRKLREATVAPFMFLTDLDSAYALALGLVMRVDDALHGLMLERGLDLTRFHGNDNWLLPVPATFVVARGGVIRARHVDPDFRTRMAIDQILATLPG